MVDGLIFQVSNTTGGEVVDLTLGETIIVYQDASQTETLVNGDFTATGIGNADSDKLVEPGELYEVKITGLEAKLDTDLVKDTKFPFQVKRAKGAILHVERWTPIMLDTVMDLG